MRDADLGQPERRDLRQKPFPGAVDRGGAGLGRQQLARLSSQEVGDAFGVCARRMRKPLQNAGGVQFLQPDDLAHPVRRGRTERNPNRVGQRLRFGGEEVVQPRESNHLNSSAHAPTGRTTAVGKACSSPRRVASKSADTRSTLAAISASNSKALSPRARATPPRRSRPLFGAEEIIELEPAPRRGWPLTWPSKRPPSSPVPASERVQPLSVASGDGVAALPVGEPPRFRQFTGVERLSNESLPDDRLEIFRDASSEIVDGAASNDVSHGSHIRVTPMGHSWRREPVVLKGFL